MPKRLEKYIGVVRGQMAPGERISVDTPMDDAQRDLDLRHIWKYVEKSKGIDLNLFGYATAVKDSDGNLKLINGQHRIELIKNFAPSIKEVPAHIIGTDDPKYAAQLFAKMNGVASRNITAEQLFHANCLAEDPDALFYKDVLERSDLACGKVNADKKRKSVKYANFTKAVGMGVDETIRSAELIDLAYPKNAMNDLLLSGMTRLFSFKGYAELMDPGNKIYKEFEDWFVTFLPSFASIDDLNFRETRATNMWHDGVAYGLFQKFAYYQRKNNRWVMPIDNIKQNYEKGIKTDPSY